MTSAASETAVRMIDALPEAVQERVVEHLQDYIADVRDEMKWNESFARSQDKLVAAAKKAREDIARGLATPLDIDQL
jgi:glycerate-2-kinase